MRVSVIIPTYNSGALVTEALRSVLAQTRPADEVIVVDDGSTDGTEEQIRPYLRYVDFIKQPNGRVAAARNAGLERASGDVVAFLDADDAWHPCKLERQLAVLDRHPEIGLLATELAAWPGRFVSADQVGAGVVQSISLASMLLTNPIATSSIVVRRSVLERAGTFDTGLFGPEDYDLWLRCAQIAGVAILQEALTGYRDTSGSLGKQAETMRQGLLKIHAKLDTAGVWKSAWFRRKCRAHIDYSTGYMYYAGGNPGRAASLLLQSLLTYPLPISPPDVRYHWARVRLLLRSVSGLCRASLLPRRVAAEICASVDAMLNGCGHADSPP